MKRRMMMILTAGMLALGLTGCGENRIPEMSAEEMQLMGEYTAITMMRYDARGRSRLVDLSLLEMFENAAAAAEELQESTSAGMDPVEDTPVINAGSQGAQGTQGSQGTQGGASSSTMEEVLGLPEGVSIIYTGYELYEAYPDDASNFFTITATEGKRLLVLNFSIANASAQEQQIDFLEMEPEFRIAVNGGNKLRAMITMLDNDLATYKGTIPAMEGVSAVLVIEAAEADAQNLTSISLNLKNESETYTIQLL